MKYCPYCGADFAEGAASFCMECGKSLPIAEDGQKKPKEKPVKSQKRMEKKRKHPSPKSRKNMKSLSANTWEELFIQRTMDMTATMTMFCLQTQEN